MLIFIYQINFQYNDLFQHQIQDKGEENMLRNNTLLRVYLTI
ncbi:hypothetical protein pb186bvf_017401 [Paramecium bursaria]